MLTSNFKGATLSELLVTLAIFSIVMAGVYSAYTIYSRHATREYRLAQSEIELVLAKNIIERDVMMAGYGLADDYAGFGFSPGPVSIGATDNITPGSTPNPLGGRYPTTGLAGADALYMMGTALGIYSRAAQAWTYLKNASPAEYQIWEDDRENVHPGDRIIYVEPNTRTLIAEGSTWRFVSPSAPAFGDGRGKGSLVYGLSRPPQGGGSEIPRPYYIIQYRLGGTPSALPKTCAPGTRSLQRVEMTNGESVEPLLACVRDIQIAFGLDAGEPTDGMVDFWDNGGNVVSSYDSLSRKRRLKQVRVYLLVQQGERDPDYLYKNPGNPSNPARIRVGDAGLGIGRDVNLTAEQRKYHWRLIALTVTPRNNR